MHTRESPGRQRAAELIVQRLIGLPFETNGRGPAAYDCFGIMLAAYRIARIELPDPYEGGTFDEKKLVALRERFVKVDEPYEFLDVMYSSKPQAHVAIVVSGGYALESMAGCNSKLVRLDQLAARTVYRYQA